MGSHSITCHPAEVTFPPLPQPIKAGTRFSDPGGMQGWVNLVGLVTYRGGIPAKRRSPIPALTGLNVEQLRATNDATAPLNRREMNVCKKLGETAVGQINVPAIDRVNACLYIIWSYSLVRTRIGKSYDRHSKNFLGTLVTRMPLLWLRIICVMLSFAYSAIIAQRWQCLVWFDKFHIHVY